jgi:hypothetical protein
MKWMLSAATATVLWVGMLSPGRLDGASPSPELLASYHFAGVDSWSGKADGTKFREILSLPQTEALGRHLVERLAQSPRVLFPAGVDDSQSGGGLPLLRPLLADVLRHESFLELRRREGVAPTWLFGIALPLDRGLVWERNLTELEALWKLGATSVTEKDGVSVTTIRRESNPTVVRWGQSGGWLLLGVGAEPMAGWDEMLAGVRQSRRPRPVLSNGWMEVELDVARLRGVLGLSGGVVWPRVSMSASDRGEDMLWTGRLVFGERVTGSLDPWQVPTNIIREPLIGFGAWRGARPMLEHWELLTRLGIKEVPNEVYFWSQALSVPQSLFAFPSNDATNRVRAMLEPGRELIPARWRERGLGQLEWREEEAQLVWRSLPILYPHVRGLEDGGRGYIVGGTFPALHTTNAPPRELLDQLEGKRDLIFYHWEITARRLAQLRMQVQLGSMVTGKTMLQPDSPVAPWLEEMERRLDNAATEVVALSSKEWSFTRRAPIGLTAAELVGLLCWTESLDFPRLNFRFPEHTTPKAAPAVPRKKR